VWEVAIDTRGKPGHNRFSSDNQPERMHTSPSQPTGPVSRIARRKAKAGCEACYEAIVRGMFAETRHFPGFLGADLIPPSAPDTFYQVVMRFASQADLERWDASEARQAWHARLGTVADGDPDYRLLSGLEAWFSLPSAPMNHPPERWKMAVLTWLGIFPTVSLLLYAVAPLLADLPFLARTAVITGLAVVMMTWLVMPRLVGLFKPWLTRAKTN